MSGPANLPPDVVNKLEAAVQKALAEPETQKQAGVVLGTRLPTVASVLSAWGMLTSDLRYEVARTRAIYERGRPLLSRLGNDLRLELALIWLIALVAIIFIPDTVTPASSSATRPCACSRKASPPPATSTPPCAWA